MSVAVGSRIGAYEVVALLGAGGMGEVYRARDTKLNRDVALKVLPEQFANQPERVARFEREAHLLASLNHPHIAQIYAVENLNGVRALAMELVPGRTLGETISDGAPGLQARGTSPGAKAPGLRIDESVAIARQIAGALEAAHEKGIIHRDLKPGNVMITPEGEVKLLDFGLGKSLAAEAESDPSDSPTMTAAATQAGMLLGTAAYMSPEQARGRVVDKRSDIWAFGCVLYEMLTGKRAFAGEGVSETLALILMKDPDWTRLPAATPAGVVSLVRSCLARDRKARIPEIAAVRFLLDHALAPASAADLASSTTSPAPRWRVLAQYAAAVAVAVAVTAGGMWLLTRPTPASISVTRFIEALPSGRSLPRATGPGLNAGVVISPDGRTLVYVAYESGSFHLFRRRLDEPAAAIIGDVGAQGPVFSADGGSLAFWVSDAGQGGPNAVLARVRVHGGPSELLARGIASNAIGWDADGTILFGMDPLPPGAGAAAAVTADPSRRILRPQVLPGGRAILGEKPPGQIVVAERTAGSVKDLLPGTMPRYVPTGHVIFKRDDKLWAAPFNVSRLELTGEPLAVVEPVRLDGSPSFSVSETGTLAYLPGPMDRRSILTWVDRDGREAPVSSEPRQYSLPRLSPDGKTIATALRDPGNDVWLMNVADGHLRPFTSDPIANFTLAWFPDGKRLAFSRFDMDRTRAFSQTADGSGAPVPLADTPIGFPSSVAPDGSVLVCFPSNQGCNVLPPGASDVKPLMQTPGVSRNPVVSYDGRWVAYETDQTSTPGTYTGRNEIHVRPFPDVSGGDWIVSKQSDCCPVWSRSGRELFFWRENGTDISILSVPIGPGSGFTWGPPKEVARGPYVKVSWDTPYDEWNGRFLVIKSVLPPPPNQIVVIQNWFDELKRRVPVK